MLAVHMNTAKAAEGRVIIIVFARLERLMDQLRPPPVQGHGHRGAAAPAETRAIWQPFIAD
jgi:hypothetical protein